MGSNTGNLYPEVILEEKSSSRDDPVSQTRRMSHEDECTSPVSSVAPPTAKREAIEGDSRQLGRSRPDEFTSTWKEVGFVMSVSLSMIFDEYLTSGFLALLPVLMRDFNLTNKSITWPSSVPSLVVSAFLLGFGRLADRYGGFPIYAGGMVWALVWTLAAGFSVNIPMLIFCRAMQGLGAAAHLPSGLMMLGRLYRPGPRKNVVFCIYGAMAPFGFFVGMLVAGLVSQYAHWSWYFWIGAIIAFLAFVGSYLTTPSFPRTDCGDEDVQMDWLGSITLATGVILLVFAVTEAADAPQGWRTPYILATAISAMLSLTATFVVEVWSAKQPLLPASLFRTKCLRPLLLGLLLSYGTVGIYVCYATLYIRDVIGIGSVQLIAWFAPMAIGGCCLAVLSGFLMHVISGTIVLIITCLAIMAASLLFVFAPTHPLYWMWIFPAMICATIAIDLIVNVANVFLSSKLQKHQQGLAGGLAHVTMQFSIAFFLGVARNVATYTSDQGKAQSYKNVFWLQFACGAAALMIFLLFVRIDKAKCDQTPSPRLEDSQRQLATTERQAK